jgi:beta-glucanase (GH16 family)
MVKYNSLGKKIKLVWHDEFSYNGLPDSTKWNYEVGLNRRTEKQYYTQKRLDNIFVKKGFLTIKAKKEKFKNPDLEKFKNQKLPEKYLNAPKDSIPGWLRNRFDTIFNYTSASIVTLHKASWTYGRIEIRAKLPSGKGVWPVIWMMGSNIDSIPWPYCGEIDIMEYVGRMPNTVQSNVHYASKVTKQHLSNAQKIEMPKPFKKFHIYAMEWDEKGINFFADNKLYHSVDFGSFPSNVENPFLKPLYLLMNFALGGSFGGPIDDANLPQELTIDYVRMYQ